jgi:carbamoyltransferase
MRMIPEEFGMERPLLSDLVYRSLGPLMTAFGRIYSVYREESDFACAEVARLQRKLDAGETTYVLGINSGIHNSGVSLIRVSKARGIDLICNYEEERYSEVKHEERYPEGAVADLAVKMRELGISTDDIFAVVAGWAQMEMGAFGAKTVFEHAPVSLKLAHPRYLPEANLTHVMPGLLTPRNLARQLGFTRPIKMINAAHHGNHASASYALSPFGGEDNVMVSVIDAMSDTGGISVYISENARPRREYSNRSLIDSLGILYSSVASALGGWKRLSSEGRLMGLSAFGDMNRETNPFYPDLRHILRLGSDGSVEINRALLNVARGGALDPFTDALKEILGEPTREDDLWDPNSDEVFTSERIRREIPEVTLHRAAALQLVFEDGVFHVVEDLIERSHRRSGTASNKLVLTGGTALNCIANMKLLDRFDSEFYRQRFGEKNKTLHIWVPPFPGDPGVAVGAAYSFAMKTDVPLGEKMKHAFYAGLPPTTRSIREAVDSDPEIEALELGNIKSSDEKLRRIADFLALLVENNHVVGLFQGEGETGPRALGHRTILADPRRRETLDLINKLVKRREAFRPLAPFGTLEAVLKYCDIDPGGGLSDDNFNSLNYMVIAVRARPEAREVVPAVVHEDGSVRVQVVREETDPFTHAYLKALGRRIGVEMSVNTSLNIGGPIVQTAEQAVNTLKKSAGMIGIAMIGDDGEALFAYHNVDDRHKDFGAKLSQLFGEWKSTAVV